MLIDCSLQQRRQQCCLRAEGGTHHLASEPVCQCSVSHSNNASVHSGAVRATTTKSDCSILIASARGGVTTLPHMTTEMTTLQKTGWVGRYGLCCVVEAVVVVVVEV